MNRTVNVKPIADENNVFIIHPQKAREVNLDKKKLAYVCFGNQKRYVSIKIDEEISMEDIVISKKLIDEMHLPEYPTFEMRVNQNEIIIGPYIGLLITEDDKNLTPRRLNKIKVYIREYSKLHGMIIVFALNKVDATNRLITGYGYNPIMDCWQRGTFPYPSAIYRTIGLKEEWKNHFLSVIGDKLFNNNYFSKWKMYQWFSKDTEINPHIPYTTLYQSPNDILESLKKFNKIFIKPILGLQGRGIVRVSTENETFVFEYREKGANRRVVLKSLNEVIEFIENHFNNRKFLIQQAIELIKYEDRVIDFRCVMQKDQSNTWQCKAIIGRLGDDGSIVSNISNGGIAFRAVDILKKVMPSSQKNIINLNKKIESLAGDVCKTLDEFGINCGFLGLDIGIDTKGCLWLIEINNRDPDPTIALDINDEQLYYTLKTSQLLYAKSLAGFGNFK